MVAGEAQGLPCLELVDLDDQAVGVVGPLVPPLAGRADVLWHLGKNPEMVPGVAFPQSLQIVVVREESDVPADLQAQGFQLSQDRQVTVRRRAEVAFVYEDVQRHRRHLGALDPMQGARCQVAWIGVGGLHAGIDLGEEGPGQEDLPPGRHRGGAQQAQGHRSNSPHVGGYVVADESVAAGHRPDEQPFLVVQHDRGAVDLLLDHERELTPGVAAGLVDPAGQLFDVVGLVETENGDGMGDLGQLTGEVRTHPLGGRVGALQLRKTALELQEAIVQPIVLPVAHAGLAFYVVLVLIAGQEGAEFLDLPGGLVPARATRRAGGRHP